MQPELRKGAAWEFDKDGNKASYDVQGTPLQEGQTLPDFVLFRGNPDYTVTSVSLADLPRKMTLLMLVNSVYTPVCRDTACVVDLREQYFPRDVQVVNVSTDTPFALEHFRQSKDLKSTLFLSDHRTGDFGRAYGALMLPDKLLQRAIIVADPDRVIQRVAYFEDQGKTPDLNQFY